MRFIFNATILKERILRKWKGLFKFWKYRAFADLSTRVRYWVSIFLQLLRHENFFAVFLWLQLSFLANYRESTWLVNEAPLIQRYKSCSWVENIDGSYLVRPLASKIRPKSLDTSQWGEKLFRWNKCFLSFTETASYRVTVTMDIGVPHSWKDQWSFRYKNVLCSLNKKPKMSWGSILNT